MGRRPLDNSWQKYHYKTNTKATRAADPHLRPIKAKWDSHDTKFMDLMRTVEIRPTRVGSESTLSGLGLLEDTEEMFKTIGLGHLWRIDAYVYPELVREFCATCRVHYKNPQEPKASEGTLCFFLNKNRKKIPINDFCEIYGFEKGEMIQFPKFTQADKFWDLIGDGNYIPRAAKITSIRNPVLRIVVKLIGNTFFCKAEAGAVRDDELWMLFLGVRHLLQGYEDVEIPDVNYGAMMGAMFEDIKKHTRKVLYVGTILTPLFVHCGINLEEAEIMEKVSYVNTTHLDSCHIIRKLWIYQFQDRYGVPHFINLPNAITKLTSRDSLEFQPGPEYLCPDPHGDEKPTRRRRSTSAPPAPPQTQDDPQQEDNICENPVYAPPAYPAPDSDKFMLPELPAQSDTSARQDWLIEATITNNSLMRKILSIVSCFRPPSTSGRRPTEQTCDETAGTESTTDIAGLSNTQSMQPPASPQNGRLKRRRRQSPLDQSSSESLPDSD